MATKSSKKNLRESAELALWDTLEVALWTGVPASGVSVYLELAKEDLPEVAKYSALIAAGINTVVYFLKRLVGYKKGQI